MSEAIILYRGRGGVDPERLKPTTITNNGIYEAPVTGTYRVSCVGGGGGGGGGCRNSWNSSQVFYGAGGSRGTLTTMNVTLNASDKIQVNLGAGGAGGVNNTTVVSNNSRGTNGSAGGTTTFGSLVSGAGGMYGQLSWSYHYWHNYGSTKEVMRTISGWGFAINMETSYLRYDTWTENKGYANGGTYYNHARYICFNSNMNNYGHIMYLWRPYLINGELVPGYGAYLYNANIPDFMRKCVGGATMQSSNNIYKVITWDPSENSLYGGHISGAKLIYTNSYSRWQQMATKYKLVENHNTDTGWHGLQDFYYNRNGHNNWNALVQAQFNCLQTIWNNTIQNINTNCYTSIQQGSWWYTSANNVTTSGTRTYRGDGGASGQAGNAGFILVIPPTT